MRRHRTQGLKSYKEKLPERDRESPEAARLTCIYVAVSLNVVTNLKFDKLRLHQVDISLIYFVETLFLLDFMCRKTKLIDNALVVVALTKTFIFL